MNNKDAKHLAKYVHDELEDIKHEIEFLLTRMEQAETKYGINKQKAKIARRQKNGKNKM